MAFHGNQREVFLSSEHLLQRLKRNTFSWFMFKKRKKDRHYFTPVNDHGHCRPRAQVQQSPNFLAIQVFQSHKSFKVLTRVKFSDLI